MPTILARIPPEVRARFDIVGYDPRGVGRSTRVMCGLQRYAPPGPRPWNIGEIETYLDSQARWMRTCLRDSGRALLENVSSAEAARDLDIVRAALGDRRLHYWGISYGAYIGALYAQFFPDRIGKMMLDSSMSTTASVPAIAHLQAKGLQKEFTAWARWCGRTVATCPVRGSAATVTERVVAWLDRLHRHPIPMGSEPEVTYHEVVGVIAYAMGRGGWPGFRSTNRIVRALRDRDGATLRAYTESASLGRDVRNEIDSQAAINCLDRRGEVSALRTIGHMREWSAEAPVFGEVWAVRGSACTGWPVANRATTTPLDVRDAPPVLLLAVRTDPISPLILSRQMQDQLHGSRLVVWEGMGHGASLRGDACIDTTLSRFFARGRLPADGKTCPQR